MFDLAIRIVTVAGISLAGIGAVAVLTVAAGCWLYRPRRGRRRLRL